MYFTVYNGEPINVHINNNFLKSRQCASLPKTAEKSPTRASVRAVDWVLIAQLLTQLVADCVRYAVKYMYDT